MPRVSIREQVRDLPVAMSHLALVGTSLFTALRLYKSEDVDVKWTYGALALWSIIGLLGGIIHGMKEPPEKLRKLYNDIQFARPCLDLPLVLADLYVQKGMKDLMSMSQVIAGLLPIFTYINNYTDFAELARKCIVPSSLISGLILMALNRNGIGFIVMATYGVAELGVEYGLQKIMDIPPMEPSGLRALGLSAFSLVLHKLFTIEPEVWFPPVAPIPKFNQLFS